MAVLLFVRSLISVNKSGLPRSINALKSYQWRNPYLKLDVYLSMDIYRHTKVNSDKLWFMGENYVKYHDVMLIQTLKNYHILLMCTTKYFLFRKTQHVKRVTIESHSNKFGYITVHRTNRLKYILMMLQITLFQSLRKNRFEFLICTKACFLKHL